MFQEIGPVYPFAPSYGVYPTTTIKYRFQIDIRGNVLIQSQLTTHPKKADPVIGTWSVELQLQDNVPIPREMMDIIRALLEDTQPYHLMHWRFVIDVIRTVKERSVELYQDVYLEKKRLSEEVDVLKAQKEQLERRLGDRRG
jgi:hypothetical protein